MDASGIDQIQLSFSPTALAVLNGIIAVILFGVALDIRWQDFRSVTRRPQAVLAGLFCQFLLLPAIAWGCILLLRPHPSIALGLGLGSWLARQVRLSEAESRAVAFETGIQNSGFGLVLCFNHFAGLGGMAMIAAWWGVWHLISGLTLASLWRRSGTAAGA